MCRARAVRRVSRAALALLAAVCVLVSVVLGGHRYFFCPYMNEVSLNSCCASEATHGEEPAIEREACCTAGHFATPLPSTTTAADVVLRAPFLAVVPIPVLLAAQEARRAPPPAFLARAGPMWPSARARRLRVMVFLT